MKICDDKFDYYFKEYNKIDDWLLMKAIAWTESNYIDHAVSHAGAIGVMQIMPATGLLYGMEETKLYEPSINIMIGCLHFKALMGIFDNDIKKSIAGYNCGGGCVESRIRQHGTNWVYYLPEETRNYLPKVLDTYDKLKKCPSM